MYETNDPTCGGAPAAPGAGSTPVDGCYGSPPATLPPSWESQQQLYSAGDGAPVQGAPPSGTVIGPPPDELTRRRLARSTSRMFWVLLLGALVYVLFLRGDDDAGGDAGASQGASS